MAKLGFRTMDEMIGRVDLIEMKPEVEHWKARGLDFESILYNPQVPGRVGRRQLKCQDHGLSEALDHQLLREAEQAIENSTPVEFKAKVRNVHRAVGPMLSGQVARRHGSKGLPDGTVKISLTGSAGQSFGAFLAEGVTLLLEGEANDYVGKGLSGVKIIVFPPAASTFAPEENILIGNTTLYGATSGEAYFAGVAGERFAVRNSGAISVVEGVGDHGCEYMTGGTVVVLGRTGRNFAAGMSGGIAFVLDEFDELARKCNTAMVDLEKITESSERETLKRLVQQHARYTGSARAKRELGRWDIAQRYFV